MLGKYLYSKREKVDKARKNKTRWRLKPSRAHPLHPASGISHVGILLSPPDLSCPDLRALFPVGHINSIWYLSIPGQGPTFWKSPLHTKKISQLYVWPPQKLMRRIQFCWLSSSLISFLEPWWKFPGVTHSYVTKPWKVSHMDNAKFCHYLGVGAWLPWTTGTEFSLCLENMVPRQPANIRLMEAKFRDSFFKCKILTWI